MKIDTAGDLPPTSIGPSDVASILQERDRIEREFATERERLQITLASIGDGVISTDADGRVQFLNGVAETLTGWAQAEAAGHPLDEVFRIVDEVTREPRPNPALQALREGRVVELANHTLLISRDGSERPIDDSAAPMFDEQGAPLGAVLVFRDVSEKKRAEEAQLRLAAIVESSDDAILSKTLDGIIRSWNAGAERLFGYTPEEVVGRHISLLIPRDRLDEEETILSRLRRGERIEHFDTVRMRKDGRYLDISLTISPLKDHEGRIVGASKIARDITERKRSDVALREAAGRLVLALEAARLGDFSWDIETDLMTLSQRAAEIFGVPADGRLTARQIESLLHEEDRGRARLEAERAGSQGMPYDVEYRVIRPGGEEVWVSAKGRTEYSPGGVAVGMIGVVQDITEKKRLEQQLRQRAAELALADRKKDDFIALLAHELRNPLAPILTGLQVMRRGDPDAVARAGVMMDRQLSHMVRMIDDLLDISRMSRNKLHLQRSKVTLGEVINHALEVAGPAVTAAGHQLHLSLPPEEVALEVDLTRLAQVFGNILTNAAKYTPRGGEIWLGAEVRGGEVIVSIRDSGIGIPSAALERVFDMFSQVDPGALRVSGGLGIGLALVKALVEAHGGRVTAASPGPGAGSTFTVYLQGVPRFAEPAATAETRPETGSPRTGRRVLVADDNEDAAASLAELLELLGNEVHIAHDGLQAVETAERVRPDLVLMDIGMPTADGLTATRRLRERPWSRATTIVALTGWGQEGDRERTRAAGCDDHLVKPVTLPQLERLLAALPATRPPSS